MAGDVSCLESRAARWPAPDTPGQRNGPTAYSSSKRVDDHTRIDPVSAPGVRSEERRRAVVGVHGREAAVATEAAATVRREPLDTATGVASEEGLDAW